MRRKEGAAGAADEGKAPVQVKTQRAVGQFEAALLEIDAEELVDVEAGKKERLEKQVGFCVSAGVRMRARACPCVCLHVGGGGPVRLLGGYVACVPNEWLPADIHGALWVWLCARDLTKKSWSFA